MGGGGGRERKRVDEYSKTESDILTCIGRVPSPVNLVGYFATALAISSLMY